MIEIALLASTVVTKFLVPLFRRGKQGFADGLAEEEGRAAAAGLVETAEKIWTGIVKRFDRDSEKNAVELFRSDPEAMEKMLVKLLQARLEEDEGFRRQIDQLVEAPIADTNSTSWKLMGDYVGAVDARNANISGGITAGVVIGREAQQGRETDLSKIPPAGDAG